MSQLKSNSNNIRSAALYMAAMSLMFAIMGLTVRMLAPRISAGQALFTRCFVGLLFTLLFIQSKKASYLGTQLKKLSMRGIFGALAGITYFEAVARIPLADAIGIYRSSTLFMPLIAYFILKEKVKPQSFYFALFGFFGVLFILKPSYHINHAAWIALVGAIFNASAWASVRSLAQKESPYTIMLYFFLFCSILSLILYSHNFVSPTLAEWLLLLLTSIAGFAGQVFLTKSYALADASIVTPLGYLEIPFMVILGLIFLSEVPDLFSVFGILVVVVMSISIIRS